jgi:AcrR family transcriptional regulator
VSGAAERHRPYDNSRRRQQAAGTRTRIVSTGCDLLRKTPIRDWRGLTIRAVADHAGVSESTVYRNFGTEKGLKDAVMRQLEEEAGIDLDGMELEEIASISGRIFESVSSHPFEERVPLDSTLQEAGQRQQEALVRAVADHTAVWSESDRLVAAAMLDVLWSVGAYERLAVDWHLDHHDSTAGIAWVIELIEEAIRAGRPPHGRGHRP